MTPEVALQKRGQAIRDGYCVVDDILTEDFLTGTPRRIGTLNRWT